MRLFGDAAMTARAGRRAALPPAWLEGGGKRGSAQFLLTKDERP
jgi:hypothetical protein